MKPLSPENSGENYSAADLPDRQAGLWGTCLAGRQVIPSDFVGIVRLTNFSLPTAGRFAHF